MLLEINLKKYMKDFSEVIYGALRNIQDYQLCKVAVGVIGDISRALGIKIRDYCDNIIGFMLQDLQNGSLHRSVKPPILSCFGDIALAIGGQFEKYFVPVMGMLQQATFTATSTRLDQIEDVDLIDYINSLREGIFEAYTGIIQGLRGDKRSDILLPFVGQMLQLVGHVWQDNLRSADVTRGAVGLLGDLAHSLGPKVKQHLNQEFIQRVINDALASTNQVTKDVAQWTKEKLSSM